VDEEGQIWAQRFFGADPGQTRFDVFRADGSWLGVVTVPAVIQEYSGQLVTTGYLYAVVEDDEGRPKVARFRIVGH
jgi:hypothetical protein